MLEHFLPDQIISYISLAGTFVSGAVAWWQSRKVRKVEEQRAAYELYKEMYDSMREDMKSINEQVVELQEHRALDAADKAEIKAELAHYKADNAALNESVQALRFCPHKANCPVQRSLGQLSPTLLQPLKGRHRPRDSDMSLPLDSANVESDHPP